MMEKRFKSLKLRIHIEVQSFLWFKLVILRNSLKHLSKSCKILLVVLYKININNVSSSKLLECKFSSQKLLWSFTTSGKRTIEQVKAVITSYPGLMISLKVAGKSEIVGRQANMAAMLFSQIKGRLGTIQWKFPNHSTKFAWTFEKILNMESKHTSQLSIWNCAFNSN